MKILVTGSNGLIGSEAVEHFARQGHIVHGVDNNMRADFFGPGGDTRWNQRRLKPCARSITTRTTSVIALIPSASICAPPPWSTARRSPATIWPPAAVRRFRRQRQPAR